jgi:hypothetical protein
MKNLIIYLLFAGFITGLISCDEYGRFSYTKTKSIPINYNINVNGDFNEKGIISEYDIKKLVDLSQDVEIEEIAINGVTLSLENLPGSDADLLDIEANLEVKNLTSGFIYYVQLIKNAKHKNIPIGVIDVNKFLTTDGLTSIKKFIQEIVDPVTAQGASTATLIVKGKAYSAFSGDPETINAKLAVNINATITYSKCEKVGLNILGRSCGD